MNGVCPRIFPGADARTELRMQDISWGSRQGEEKREEEEEHLGEAFQLRYGADTCESVREGWVGQERFHQPVRSWCIMSSHRAVCCCPVTGACTAAWLSCPWGQIPKPQQSEAVGSMHSLEQVFPWVERRMVHHHGFPSHDSMGQNLPQPTSHDVSVAKWPLHKYSFQVTYPMTFIRKFLCKTFLQLIKSKMYREHFWNSLRSWTIYPWRCPMPPTHAPDTV